MPHEDLKPFVPQTLPLRKLHRASFSTMHRRATKSLKRFHQLLDTAPHPERLFSSLLATEAIAALESQKVSLALEEFFLLCQTRTHKQKTLLQPIYYYCALKRAILDVRTQHINKEMLCRIHEMVKKGAPPHIQAGDYRTRQNWIGRQGCKKEEAYFFPPTPKAMRSSMQNLFQYCNKNTKDPLTQIAILIAQFLIVHPFMDGNGRTARIMIPLLFYRKKVLPYPLLFFSRYFKDNRKKYLQNLYAISEKGNWEQWIHFFLKGFVHSERKEYEKAEKIYHLYLKLKKKLDVHHIHFQCLFFLFSHPLFARSTFIKRYSTDLFRDLAALKIIKPFKKEYWTFPALLGVIKNKNPGK